MKTPVGEEGGGQTHEKELQQFRSSLLSAPQREADLVVGPKERGFFGEKCLEIEGRFF